MYVCMHACMSMSICMCMYVCLCLCLCICMRLCLRICMCSVSVYVQYMVYVCVCVCVCVCVGVRICVCVCVYVIICVCVCKHVCIHTSTRYTKRSSHKSCKWNGRILSWMSCQMLEKGNIRTECGLRAHQMLKINIFKQSASLGSSLWHKQNK